jgi:hypothetical protein
VNFDGNSLLLSLLTSAIGFALFTYGRKTVRLPQLVGGIALMIYPYFVDNTAWSLGIGAAICIAVWVAVRLGW